MRRLIATLFTLVLVAAACGDSDDTVAEGADLRGTTVTLVTHDSFNLTEAVLDQFTVDTGIEVQLLAAGDAGTMVNQAILTAGDPVGDVMFGVDNTLLSKALDAGVFTAYDSPALAAVPDALQLDGSNRALPVDFGDVCLNYDTAFFDQAGLAPPAGFDDLVDPAYRDLTVVQNPATSSPGLAFLLATVATFGSDGFEDYWARLRDNGVAVADGWEAAYYGDFTVGGGGDRPIVVSYASSPPAEVIFADPRPAEAPTAVVASTCFRQIEFVGVLDGAANPGGAQALIDFLLSTPAQEDIPLNMFVFPANENAGLPAEFVEFTVVPETSLSVPAADIDANRETWVEAWTDVVVR